MAKLLSRITLFVGLLTLPLDAQNSIAIAITSGASQTAELNPHDPVYPGGRTTFKPIALKVTSADGKGRPGVSVCPGVNQPQGQSCSVGYAGGCGMTNQNGDVAFGSIQCYGGTSDWSVTFSATDDVTLASAQTNTTMKITMPPVSTGSWVLTKIAGDNQKQVIRNDSGLGLPAAAFDPLQVKLVDAEGKPVSGAEVYWSCPDRNATACSMVESYNYPNTTSITDGNGIATLNRYHGHSIYLYYQPGTHHVVASYKNASVSFTETSVVGSYSSPSGIAITGGANQTAEFNPHDPVYPGGRTTFNPITLKVTGADGKGRPGVSVCPQVNQPQRQSCSVGYRGGCGTTNQNGDVAFGSIQCYGGTSDWSVTFSATDDVTGWHGQTATAMKIKLPPPAEGSWVMSKLSGDNQRQKIGSQPGFPFPAAAFDPLQVKLVDAAGRPVAGAEVFWTCSDRNATACSMIESYNYPSTSTVTDANGIATLNRYRGHSIYLYYEPGTQHVVASYKNASVTFSETSVN